MTELNQIWLHNILASAPIELLRSELQRRGQYPVAEICDEDMLAELINKRLPLLKTALQLAPQGWLNEACEKRRTLSPLRKQALGVALDCLAGRHVFTNPDHSLDEAECFYCRKKVA